jgi:hypothetical protein
LYKIASLTYFVIAQVIDSSSGCIPDGIDGESSSEQTISITGCKASEFTSDQIGSFQMMAVGLAERDFFHGE